MPPRRSDAGAPPNVTTWKKAVPVLIIAGIFDALRFMFDMFWFFGPAFAALYCGLKVSAGLSKWTLGALGAKTAGAVCIAAAGTLGVAGLEVTAVFGTVMALVVGLAGWLTVGFIIAFSNPRMLGKNIPWLLLGMLVSEVPLVNAVPAISVSVWRMYHKEIQEGKAALARWEQENAAAEQMQMRQAQEAQVFAVAEQQAAEEESADRAAAEAAEDDFSEQEETPNILAEAA